MAFGFTTNSNNVFGKVVEEAGTYNVKIVNATVNTAQSGNDYVSVDYEVLDGKYQGGLISYQSLTWDEKDQHSLEMSAKRFNSLIVACGAPDGTQFSSMSAYANSLMNRQLNVGVDWDRPNIKGQIYLTVRGFNRIDQQGSKPNGVRRPAEQPTQPQRSGANNNQRRSNGTPSEADEAAILNQFNAIANASQQQQPQQARPTAPQNKPIIQANPNNQPVDPFFKQGQSQQNQPYQIDDESLPF